MQLEPRDPSAWQNLADTLSALSNLAHAQLGLGDTRGYRRTCARILERFDEAPELNLNFREGLHLNAALRVCALAPGAVPDPLRPVLLARKSVADARSYAALNTLGILLYRAGRYEEAVRTLQEAVRLGSEGGSAFDFFFLGMAHQRLGHVQEARQWLERAVRWTTSNPSASWSDELETAALPP